jgi:glycosyltransferase involved in cell wall biosynthesis
MSTIAEHEPGSANRVKIAFCITELEPGGAERALVELVTRLDRTRFEPVVYCLADRPRGNPISLADRLEEAGVPLHCFGATSVLSVPRLLKELRAQLSVDQPKIVQTFLFHANVIGAWAARKAGVPHVVTGIRVAERRAKWHLWFARRADCFVDRHVCVSESVREFSQGQGGLPADKLMVIANAVDVERFAAAQPLSRQSIRVAADVPLLVCVGRLDEQKGIAWLLESLREVVKLHPNCELLLVGDGPDRRKLTELAEKLGLPRIHFLGFRSDVPQILAASDLLVLPSRWEGMPNVVLEAMASGLAIVATDVEGVREALGPSASEQIVAVDDPRGFSERIAVILGDAALRERLGNANQQCVAAEFTHAAMVGAYERLYTELLTGGR